MLRERGQNGGQKNGGQKNGGQKTGDKKTGDKKEKTGEGTQPFFVYIVSQGEKTSLKKIETSAIPKFKSPPKPL